MMLLRLQPSAAATEVVLQPLKPAAVCVRRRHPYSSGLCPRDVAPDTAQQSLCNVCTAIAAAAAACRAAVGHRSRCGRMGKDNDRLRRAAATSEMATDVGESPSPSRPSIRRSRGLISERAGINGFKPKVRYAWQVPQPVGPEILLVGRSNAGKSTLLNVVQDMYGLPMSARVSGKGGRTRTLNWYPINFKGPVAWSKIGSVTGLHEEDRRALHPSGSEEPGGGFCLVDCFGLGQVDYTIKNSRLGTWGPLLYNFLCERRSAVAVLHLVSSEFEGDLSAGDEQLLGIYTLAARARQANNLQPFSFGVVLTKTDLHPPEALQEIKDRMLNNLMDLGHPPENVVMCSTVMEGGHGTDDFVKTVESLSAKGWAARPAWLEEANLQWPQKAPVNKEAKDRRAAKRSFRETRSHRRGGRGASTPDLPPSI